MGTMAERVEKQLITNLPTSEDSALRDARPSEPKDSSTSPNDVLSSQLTPPCATTQGPLRSLTNSWIPTRT